jgi:hypothetical protein
MTTIVSLIALMITLISIGKRTKVLGMREYLIIFLVTAFQIIIVVIYLFTVEPPPAA